mmetsp:Transcript_22943/g.39257  ORF Transcript_22943/g.39257 Transcript_22943/m.39257 type:complete len:182 (-) Transcript_22943:304-849(-)
MKFSAAAVMAPVLAQGVYGFAPSIQPRVASTALQAEQKQNHFAAASATFLVGLGLLSAQPALANTDDAFLSQQQSTTVSSSIYVAEIESFTLPSYDSSKGTTLIDLSGEVASVNKKTLQTAKAKREYNDTSEEKRTADALRRAEKEGGSLLDSMIGDAEKAKKEAVAAEIAESRANRWKTF